MISGGPQNPLRNFARNLLIWNRDQNRRDMPWKGEKDPYKIWLSEIILQQTRVEQGLAYFERFVAAFPDIRKLASAPEEKVFKLWEGLGYYSRCRNLIFTARYIARELKGEFPADYEGIKKLKGVGPYTAAAIASFAYNLPHAVVDGNVFRVLARIAGIQKKTDTTEGKKYFTALAEQLLDKNKAGIYNQAIMDFGAVVCKPALPLCNTCIFSKTCVAFQQNRVNELPLKKKKISIRKRWFNYVILQLDNKIAIHQRTNKDIWRGLYEFYPVETEKEADVKEIIQQLQEEKIIGRKGFEVLSVSSLYKQQLTHQTISGKFYKINISKMPVGNDFIWVSKKQISKYAFPGLINQFLEEI